MFTIFVFNLSLFPFFFVFPQMCEVGGCNNHPQEDLAKFGYRLERKVKKIGFLLVIYRNLLFKYGESDFFSLTMWPMGPIFLKRKSFI